MVEICKGQNITAYLTGETSYDIVLAKCFWDDGQDIAEEIVKAGLALDIPHFPNADDTRFEPPGIEEIFVGVQRTNENLNAQRTALSVLRDFGTHGDLSQENVRLYSVLGYRPPAPETIIPIDRRPVMH